MISGSLLLPLELTEISTSTYPAELIQINRNVKIKVMNQELNSNTKILSYLIRRSIQKINSVLKFEKSKSEISDFFRDNL
mgnify:CR=1 FL=1